MLHAGTLGEAAPYVHALRRAAGALAKALGLVLLCGFARGDYQQQPPTRYQGEFTALVHFWTPEHVRTECTRRMGTAAGKGLTYFACAKDGEVWYPSPYGWSEACGYRLGIGHEGGHVLGWPGDHPD